MCKLDDFGIWSYPAASLRVGNANGGSGGISILRPKLRQATPRTTSYERDERLLSS